MAWQRGGASPRQDGGRAIDAGLHAARWGNARCPHSRKGTELLLGKAHCFFRAEGTQIARRGAERAGLHKDSDNGAPNPTRLPTKNPAARQPRAGADSLCDFPEAALQSKDISTNVGVGFARRLAL